MKSSDVGFDLGDWLLGRDRGLRLRSSMQLTSVVVNVLFALFQHAEMLLGLIDRGESNALSVVNVSGCLVFYLLVRTGLSARLSQDLSLTVPTMLWGILAVSWSYAITGPARGAVMGIMILIILFGMFGLPPRVAYRMAAFGFASLASVMAWRAWATPERYDPRVELIHFVFAAIVMGSTAVLAVRLGRLRARLSHQKAELEQALALNKELATRDALTGLLNRRAMVELLGREHPRIQRGQGPLSVALLDIDWFKRINDGHGHAVGDEVLKRFATLLRGQLRQADALARWGGEEFLLLMPGTRLQDACAVLERLRAEVAAGGFEQLAAGLQVSFSCGVVQCDEGEQQDAAIDRADRALYRAKQGGRNRVEPG
jgi:diguanylate cyclase (GGDEF)-like protein